MNSQNRNNETHRMYSVRHPRNVWMVRLLAFSVLVLTLDIPSNETKPLKQKITNWADQFIAENHLDKSFEQPTLAVQKNTYAVNEIIAVHKQEVNSPKNEIAKNPNSPNVSTSISAKKTNSENVQSRNFTATYLVPNNKTLLTVHEEIFEPKQRTTGKPVKIESSITEGWNTQDYVIHKSPSEFILSGSLGPLFSVGSISAPSGEVYAKMSSIDNLKAESLGTTTNHSKVGFSAMLNVGMTLGNNFELHTGLNYVRLNGTHLAFYDSEVQKYQTIVTGSNTNNGNGGRTFEALTVNVPYTNYFSDSLQLSYRLSSIEIPVTLKYNFGKQKLSYFVSSGVSTVIGSSYKATYTSAQFENGTIKEYKGGFNTINILFGVGVQYLVSPNVAVKIEPSYRYGIPLNNSSVIQSNTSAIGVFTGLNYYFD